MLSADCDVWLLTEVNERTSLPGYAVSPSLALMAQRRRWAAVASRLPLGSSPDPHPASAAAQVGATTYVSSVLPWKACGSRHPWVGARHADKTKHAVVVTDRKLQVVYTNAAFSGMFGYSPEEAQGRHASHFAGQFTDRNTLTRLRRRIYDDSAAEAGQCEIGHGSVEAKSAPSGDGRGRH